MDPVWNCVTKNYVNFSDRARRKEYWLFMLFYLIAYLIATGIDIGIGAYDFEAGIGIVSGIFLIAMLLPSLAVSVRRLHDIDKSGWWILIMLIPLIGAIVLLVFMCRKGTSRENRFGPDPLVEEAAVG